MSIRDYMQERICPICKKKFITYSPGWVYRQIKGSKTRYYCSYTCWRKDGGGDAKTYVRR